jgi:hypothetical protein
MSTIYDLKIHTTGLLVASVPASASQSAYNGVIRSSLLKLNLNGTLDTTFAFRRTDSGNIKSIEVQPDNKILLTGSFRKINDSSMSSSTLVSRCRVARLTSTGLIDSTFSVGAGLDVATAMAAAFKCSATGFSSVGENNSVKYFNNKILISHDSTVTYNGVAVSKFIQLNLDGTLDTTFGYTTFEPQNYQSQPNSVVISPSNEIVIGGDIRISSTLGGQSVYKVGSTGLISLFTGLNSSFFFSGTPTTPGIFYNCAGCSSYGANISTMLYLSTGQLLVGGSFTAYGYPAALYDYINSSRIMSFEASGIPYNN